MSTENIQKFLMPPKEGGAYTDEKLAELLAHTQDGKLSYTSCCCLVGSVTAPHPLRGSDPRCRESNFAGQYPDMQHIRIARDLSHARAAEEEFRAMGWNRPTRPIFSHSVLLPGEHLEEESPISDARRRERLIPLILAEMQRREAEKLPEPTCDDGYYDDEPLWNDSLTAMEREKGLK